MLIGATEPAMPTEPKKPLIVMSCTRERQATGEEVYFTPILPAPIDAAARVCAAIPTQAR
jgi:hypothetical protein